MRFYHAILIFSILAFASLPTVGQSADNRTPLLSRSEDENRPKSVLEKMEQMRIEREKKEFNEMIERGEEALKISEQIEKSFARSGKLTKENYDQIASIAKLAKKIRGDLGGNDDDDESDSSNLTEADAVKTLRERVVDLNDELKKTTRFSISAAAIEGTNAVLRIARLFRLTK